jgi:hypothetical protein
MSESVEPTPATTLEAAAPVEIPVRDKGLVGDFVDFILHNKLWWMTPIVVVLLLMVIFILVAEASPLLPFIYTVI